MAGYANGKAAGGIFHNLVTIPLLISILEQWLEQRDSIIPQKKKSSIPYTYTMTAECSTINQLEIHQSFIAQLRERPMPKIAANGWVEWRPWTSNYHIHNCQ